MRTTTKAIIGVCRFDSVQVWEPKDGKYSITLIIPKDDQQTLIKVKEAIKAAYEDGQSKLKGSGGVCPVLEAIKLPLRDGDLDMSGEYAYKNAYFINACSTSAPGIVDSCVQPIVNHDDFYSGCYGRASINFYAFNVNGNRGITCELNNLQKIKDGDRL